MRHSLFTLLTPMNTTEYRFKLASTKLRKATCPACGKRRHWQRYVDTETDEALPEQYGRCDNATKCGHSLNPYSDGYAKAIRQQEQGMNAYLPKVRQVPRQRPPQQPAQAPLPVEVLSNTLKGYEANTFIHNLLYNVPFPFDVADVQKVLDLYYLGTVTEGFRAGAVTFPFIDVQDNIRAVQVKQFDADNHTVGTGFLHTMLERRLKEAGQPLPDWLTAYLRNDAKVSCLFGEHLLNRFPMQPIALVEAPKTAIYGTLYFGLPKAPADMLWLAVYNLSSLNINKCRALAGRDVYLFPDLSSEARAFNLWKTKADELRRAMPRTRLVVSDLLERHATADQRERGCDLADFLIVQDWRLFSRQGKTDSDDQVGPDSARSAESERLDKQNLSNRLPQQSATNQRREDVTMPTNAAPHPIPTQIDWDELMTHKAEFEIDSF